MVAADSAFKANGERVELSDDDSHRYAVCEVAAPSIGMGA